MLPKEYFVLTIFYLLVVIIEGVHSAAGGRCNKEERWGSQGVYGVLCFLCYFLGRNSSKDSK